MPSQPTPRTHESIQPTRIAAMASAMLIHGAMALLLLGRPAPVQQESRPHAGQGGGVQVNFIQAQVAVAPPPPPPRPVTPKVAAAQPRPAPVTAPAVDAQEAAAAPAPVVVAAAEPDEPQHLFRTLDPTDVTQADAGPLVYGVDEELPGEFLAEVDVMPMERIEFRKTHQPIYSDEARDAGQQGIVVLKVLVDEVGFPVGIKVMRSTAGAELTIESLRAVSSWQFRPAMKDGVAVKGALLVPIYFFLDGMPPALKQWRTMGGMDRTST